MINDATNKGKGWLLITSWRRPQWEGDDGQRETHYKELSEARLAARHLGCVAGVSKVIVVRADDKSEWVCRWDKETSSYWEDQPFVKELLGL